MRWPVAALLCSGMCIAAVGCRSKCDLVEAELRSKESTAA